MPQRDGTGPAGKGPGSGRGQGDCRKSGGCLSVFVIVLLLAVAAAHGF